LFLLDNTTRDVISLNTTIGVGDGDRGARAPHNLGKKIGQFSCKIRAFFGQKSCKIREFLLIILANIIKNSGILIISQAKIM